MARKAKTTARKNLVAKYAAAAGNRCRVHRDRKAALKRGERQRRCTNLTEISG